MDFFDPVRVRQTYEAVAREYDQMFADDLAQLPMDRRFLDDVAASRRSDDPVVDLGCGPGQIGAYLGDRGVRVISVDLAQRMLKIARTRFTPAGVVAADFRNLPLSRGSCSGVVAFYALPFIGREELPAVLGELRRVVADGGLLGLATHLGEGEVYGTAEWLGHKVEPLALTLFAEDEISVALSMASFSIDEAVQRDPLPHEHQGPRIYVRATAA